MFPVATNFDDNLPERVENMEVLELFGSCDDAPIGHGRPRAVTTPVSWSRLEKHVGKCRNGGLGFNLLLNPLCLGGLEGSVMLEKRIRRTPVRAVDTGVTAVTVAHPWLVELAAETPLQIRVGVFVGFSTIEQARYWQGIGWHA